MPLTDGFTQNGDLITGNPTGVHLVSEDIAPTSGFSAIIGECPRSTIVLIFPPIHAMRTSAQKSGKG